MAVRDQRHEISLINATLQDRIYHTVITHMDITDVIQNKNQNQIVQLMQIIRNNNGKNTMMFNPLRASVALI